MTDKNAAATDKNSAACDKNAAAREGKLPARDVEAGAIVRTNFYGDVECPTINKKPAATDKKIKCAKTRSGAYIKDFN